MKHALLSASGSNKWLNCTPSARMEETYPESTSSYAEEGTLAHAFAELLLSLESIDGFDILLQKLKVAALREDPLYTDEMEGHVDTYVNYVLDQLTQDHKLFVEDKIDLTAFIEEGFGTSDATLIGDGLIEVCDLKYGKGIRVDAEENKQLMLYGLGAYYKHGLSYDIKTVRLTIVQPRLDHISTWDISAKNLLNWGEKEVKSKAKLAYAGEGDFNPGSHCRFCRAKPRCKALANFNLEIARLDFQDPHTLTDKELLEAFSMQAMLQDWAKSVSEYLLKEALAGKQWEGYKLVEGRANRKWSDEEKVARVLSIENFNEGQIFNTKIKGLGDIEKLVGKDKFPELFSKLIIKPQGAPALVPQTDKRPAMGIEQAKIDFKPIK